MVTKLEERSALTRNKRCYAYGADNMMLDRRTTSYLTTKIGKVCDQRVNNTLILLTNDPVITPAHVGVRKIDVRNNNGDMRISLSDRFVVPDARTILLSIPSLGSKDIVLLFMPGQAVFLDIQDGFKTVDYATQDADGLFYFNDDGSSQPPNTTKSSVALVLAMAANNKPEVNAKTVDTEE